MAAGVGGSFNIHQNMAALLSVPCTCPQSPTLPHTLAPHLHSQHTLARSLGPDKAMLTASPLHTTSLRLSTHTMRVHTCSRTSYLLEQHLSGAHGIGGVNNDHIVAALLSILHELDAITDVQLHSGILEANRHLRGSSTRGSEQRGQ